MKAIYFSILFVAGLFSATPTFAQLDSATTYFEPLTDGNTQFYFDEHYFLVDKDCQYKTIERIGKYDIPLKNFDGAITDYNNDGQVILTGNYSGGKKEGLFTAYFANGETKWLITFKDDKPFGLATYNYPDGLPMLTIRYEADQAFVQDFWDTRRRQQVKDGNGRFEFAVKAEGYNEYGYTYTKYQGNIKAGKPNGNWDIFLVYDNQEQDYAGYERFEEGTFKAGYDELNGGLPYNNASRLQIGPSLFFLQAEHMMSKRCTIDENQDFSMFITKRLEKVFALYDARNVITKPTKVEIEAKVNKTGTLRGLEIVDGLSNDEVDKIMKRALANISYWIPSYADENYIDDVFHIKVDTMVDEETGQLKFYNLTIEREKGI